MDEQQQAIQQIQQLVIAASQGDQQAIQTIQQIKAAAESGDQQALQILQLIQEVAQQMQQQNVQSARRGAKLNYIKSLRGQCPDGYDVMYYKTGGRLCKTCQKKKQESAGGKKQKLGNGDVINDFKESWFRGRKKKSSPKPKYRPKSGWPGSGLPGPFNGPQV